MNLEWSDDAIADLDRFAEFLHDKYPALAPRVAQEIMAKAEILVAHPLRGRPLLGARNIGRSCSTCSMPAMFFIIASMACGW
jgi:plasmid stabilization system protein ParE